MSIDKFQGIIKNVVNEPWLFFLRVHGVLIAVFCGGFCISCCVCGNLCCLHCTLICFETENKTTHMHITIVSQSMSTNICLTCALLFFVLISSTWLYLSLKKASYSILHLNSQITHWHWFMLCAFLIEIILFYAYINN